MTLFSDGFEQVYGYTFSKGDIRKGGEDFNNPISLVKVAQTGYAFITQAIAGFGARILVKTDNAGRFQWECRFDGKDQGGDVAPVDIAYNKAQDVYLLTGATDSSELRGMPWQPNKYSEH